MTEPENMRKQYHSRWVGSDLQTWNVQRLTRLAKGQEPVLVPLTDITELDELWWYQAENDVPTPRSLSEHMVLVQETDLTYPIILCQDGRLMDGMHRVVKALLEGRNSIEAVKLIPTPTPDHVNIDVSTLDFTEDDV